MVAEGTLPVHPGWRKPTVALRAERQTKVSWEEAEAIRAEYATGEHTQQQLGEAHGVSQTTICLIVRGLSHRFEPPPPPVIITPAERIERWTAAVNAAPAPLAVDGGGQRRARAADGRQAGGDRATQRG